MCHAHEEKWKKTNKKRNKSAKLRQKILRTIPKGDKVRPQTNGPKDRKVDDDLQGLTYERWNKQIVSLKKRKLASIEDSMDASIWRLKDHIKKSKERRITVASNSIDNIRTNRKTETVHLSYIAVATNTRAD